MNSDLSLSGSVMSSKLSLNQESLIKTESIELNFKKSKATDFNKSNLIMSEGNIKMPPLCEPLYAAECDNLVLTSQVSIFFLSI